jgi:alkanesulfonate monooxygenase SsuD/methylene tetrahydromethanopterin reductase-like flavin-dependent oxidoreductase (luciferase family)
VTSRILTRCVVAESRAEVERRRRRIDELTGSSSNELWDTSFVGVVDELVEQMQAIAEAGVERVMLLHLLHDDLEMVELLGREVVPRLASA